MIGMGTIVNMASIILGGIIGIIIKDRLKDRIRDTIMNGIGLAVIFIGISGSLQGLFIIKDEVIMTSNTILMIVSLAFGGLVGELIDIERRLERLGEVGTKILKVKGDAGKGFVEGFVTSSLLFCVGAMAIVGSLQEGLTGNASTLFAKALIDGIAALIFTSTLGIGVFFSIIPLGMYQGGITITAGLIESFINERLIMNLSFIGSILIFGIGINMVFGKKIKCGNLLPALLIPIIYEIIYLFI